MVPAQKQIYKSRAQNRQPQKNPHLHGKLIYDKGGMNIQQGKKKQHWTTS